MDKNYKKKHSCLRRFLTTRLLNQKYMINEQFRALAEYCQDLVFVVDIHGVIILVNYAASKVCGYEKDEIIGRHFRMFLTLDDLSQGFRIFYRALRGEGTEATKLRVRKKDGSTTVLELSGTPIMHKGKFIGGLAIARDVGEMMKRESQERIREQTFLKLVADGEEKQREIASLKEKLTELKSRSKKS